MKASGAVVLAHLTLRKLFCGWVLFRQCMQCAVGHDNTRPGVQSPHSSGEPDPHGHTSTGSSNTTKKLQARRTTKLPPRASLPTTASAA